MNHADYHCTYTVSQSPREVTDSICRVGDWWCAGASGAVTSPDDLFTVHFGETFVTFRVIELVPGKTVAWRVTDCFLHWLRDKKEWKDTVLRFAVAETGTGTRLSMTHEGLVPGIECYESCEKGWNFFAGVSLRQLITEGRGQPDRNKAARADEVQAK